MGWIYFIGSAIGIALVLVLNRDLGGRLCAWPTGVEPGRLTTDRRRHKSGLEGPASRGPTGDRVNWIGQSIGVGQRARFGLAIWHR